MLKTRRRGPSQILRTLDFIFMVIESLDQYVRSLVGSAFEMKPQRHLSLGVRIWQSLTET